jgi:hypothetical protein
MIFTVNSSTSLGVAGFARDTAKAALDKALELLRDGERDVAITAPDGEVYGPDKFDQFSLRYELKNAYRT